MGLAIRSVLFLTIFIIAQSINVSADDYHYKVPGAKSILSVSASSAGALVFVFSTNREESEEIGSGSPAIINLDGGKISHFPKLESSQTDLTAIWKNDGNHVFFQTHQGIFEADTEQLDENAKRVVASKSVTHGMALSRSESKLAYWIWQNSSLQLVVRDLATSKIISHGHFRSPMAGRRVVLRLRFRARIQSMPERSITNGVRPLKALIL